jgi:hypothetical protein
MTATDAESVRYMAWTLQDAAESGGLILPPVGDAADMLRALLSERDAARAALATARRDALEEAARVCDESGKSFEQGCEMWKNSEGGIPDAWKEAWINSDETAVECAAAIRALAAEGGQ